VQKGKGEEANLDCPVSWLLSRRRMNPHSTSGDDVWRGCAAIVHTGPKGFPTLL